ncbi:hypothetical protein [Dactylosporangium darangshiense]|uniref:hypothetical protein n=1 Tax=Dactylosporangium darangshiense TaxID=579108 RepID=UPI0036414998
MDYPERGDRRRAAGPAHRPSRRLTPAVRAGGHDHPPRALLELGAAHDAVHAWCAANGERISRVRWEVYGPDEPVPWVRVSWLLDH